MSRLSEEQLDGLERQLDAMDVARVHIEWPKSTRRALIDSARHAAAAEDMLREWVTHTEDLHDRWQDDYCPDCFELAERSRVLLTEVGR